MTENKEKVFNALCSLSQNWYGEDVFSARHISESAKISRYAALKALHELEVEGMVTKKCVGRPTIVSGGEYPDIVCEAAPPYHGWTVTEAGGETEVWKKAVEEYEKGLKEWAEGYPDKEEE